jgi:hypothetical protein
MSSSILRKIRKPSVVYSFVGNASVVVGVKASFPFTGATITISKALRF